MTRFVLILALGAFLTGCLQPMPPVANSGDPTKTQKIGTVLIEH